jgi:hypothetical protein
VTNELKAEIENLGRTVYETPKGHFESPHVRAEKRFDGVGIRETSGSTFHVVIENVRRIESEVGAKV